MPSTFTANKLFEKQATGENENTWGTLINAVLDAIDKTLSATLSKSVAGATDTTLTDSEALNPRHVYSGILTGNKAVIVPSRAGFYWVENATTGAFTLTIKTATGTGIVVAQGSKRVVYCDGTDVIDPGGFLSNVADDTSPQLGAALDTNAFAINESEAAAVASAGTTNIWATDGNTLHITGTTTISSLGTAPRAGAWRRIIFDGALTLSHNANIDLPGGASITTKAGDFAFVYAETTTSFKVLYFSEDGTPIVGSILKLKKGADVASAAALALGDDGNYFDITGTNAITSINSKGVGSVVRLHFDDALTLTHHATDLILPGGANITTAAGDEATFVEYASGDWRCTNYQKASGQPVVASAVAFTKYAESSNLGNPANGTTYTLTHGMGIRAKHVEVYLICTTTNAGYAVGDEVPISLFGGNLGQKVAAYIDSDTTVKAIGGQSFNGVYLPNKSTGTETLITASSWQVRLRCWG